MALDRSLSLDFLLLDVAEPFLPKIAAWLGSRAPPKLSLPPLGDYAVRPPRAPPDRSLRIAFTSRDSRLLLASAGGAVDWRMASPWSWCWLYRAPTPPDLIP